MLTTPKITERIATHFAAIIQEVRIPFGEAIGPAMGEVAGYLESMKVQGFGPAVFKYDVVDMPRLVVGFGFVTPGPIVGSDRVKPGVLPAGRYVTATHTGPYDNLEEATGEVIAWAHANGVRWDSRPEGSGERFASRFEIYPNGPNDEPDPNKWITEIWVKTRD